MPILSTFLGLVVKVFHNDHNPPHIHIEYAEFKAQIEITSGRALSGKLPPRSARAINEWRKLHLQELLQAWKDAQAGKMPKKIEPLE